MSGIIYVPPTPEVPHRCEPPEAQCVIHSPPNGGTVTETWSIGDLTLRTGTVWQCDCGNLFVWGPQGVRPDWSPSSRRLRFKLERRSAAKP